MTNRGMIGHIGLTNEGLFSSTCVECGSDIYGNNASTNLCSICAATLSTEKKMICPECDFEHVLKKNVYNGQAPNDKRMNVYCPACCNYFVIKGES